MNDLVSAIEKKQLKLIEKSLLSGADPNGVIELPNLKIALDAMLNRGSIEAVRLLLIHGASPNFGSVAELQDDILSYVIRSSHSIAVIELLLEFGADTGFIDTNGRTPLANAIFTARLDVASLLIKYGALSTIGQRHPSTLFSTLDQAIIHCGLDMIGLLLDNGADLCVQEDLDEVMAEADDFQEFIWTDNNYTKKAEYIKNDHQLFKRILADDLQPYLRIEGDSYIIYENKTINEEIEIYLLANKSLSSGKKYLYQDNKIDLFVYWCYRKGLLVEAAMGVMENYISAVNEINCKNIQELLINTFGKELTIEYFSKSGADFACSYLTVTHWWFSLHFDFNKLYAENSELPHSITSPEEFNGLLKILDIRFSQFESGRDFNPNFSKRELSALVVENI